jgi:probable rRNA maturation factor
MSEVVVALIEDKRWNEIGLEALAERACAASLVHLGLPPEGFEISLMGCNDARIAALNADFRGKPQPTNVLSWPAEDIAPAAPGAAPAKPAPGTSEDPNELGDIAIAFDTCQREAADAGRPIADHATHLLVHATLHLLGYDHIRDEDAATMEGIEVAILAGLGVADPYWTE